MDIGQRQEIQYAQTTRNACEGLKGHEMTFCKKGQDFFFVDCGEQEDGYILFLNSLAFDLPL